MGGSVRWQSGLGRPSPRLHHLSLQTSKHCEQGSARGSVFFFTATGRERGRWIVFFSDRQGEIYSDRQGEGDGEFFFIIS